MLNEDQIKMIIRQELEKFKEKNLSFRSWLKVDTATDSFTVTNKANGTTNFLPISGGTLTGDLIVPSLKITGNVGFYNGAETAKQTVTGSRGANAALASLLTALSNIGLITDSSS